uniref:phenylalanine--tRNA ligase n=1 Tax=Eutreptiella gymnastica TaxID=73025 RepID=A0A7S4CJL3_9EUGL
MAAKEQKTLDKKKLQALSDTPIYKIDLPANRYDLLSIESFAVALKVFMGDMPPPVYKAIEPPTPHEMVVSESVRAVRPYVVCAVLRNVTFSPASYKSFIDLQDKLHQNLCRKRTLVSVGTHDMDTVKGPFKYDAVPRKEIDFVPLKEEQVLNGENFIEHYQKDLQLCKFLHMIEKEPNFPLIRDADDVVMSLPPIINSRHSQITLDTKNIFIEATAVDEYKANVCINQIIAAFSYYCKEQFTVEPVTVKYADGRQVVTPDLSTKEMECKVDWMNRSIGIEWGAEDMARCLTKMLLEATVKDANTISVKVPPTRSDILHQVDVMEDVAIAYGYNNIVKKAPPTLSVGKQEPHSKLSHMVRMEFAQAGYNEALTLSLASYDDCFVKMRKEKDLALAVSIANPQTPEFQMCRISLLPGLMRTVFASIATPVPIKLFEVSDVVLKDATQDTGSRNERRAAAVYCSTSSALDTIHGLMDHVLQMLGCAPKSAAQPDGYRIAPSEDAAFFPGRQAEVFVKGQKVGIFGIIHPQVLKAFGVGMPVTAMELNLEPFV